MLARTAAFSMTLLLFLTACSTEDDPVSSARSGRFLDAGPVQGLAYQTASRSGFTGADGGFAFTAGERITFSLGDITLPEVPAAATITPLAIFSTNDTDDVRVSNLSRLLQALDDDGVPENGIRILDSAAASATGLMIDFSAADFDEQVVNLVANSGAVNTELPSIEDAAGALDETLDSNNLGDSGCPATHRFVGRTAEFETFFHGVTGTLTVVDDCTISIQNFNYDGEGPSVFFYAGNNRSYRGGNVFVFEPQLDGTVWVDDSFTLRIPDDQSLDTFDSISVWCFDFNVNFGDVFFGDA